MTRVEFIHYSSYVDSEQPSTYGKPFHVAYLEQIPRIGEFVTLPELEMGKVMWVHWTIPPQKASASVRVHLQDMNPEVRPDF